MEINLRKLGEQAIESTTGSKAMRLSKNATSMVFQLFTKSVYSNPVGTVVREITSNCFDSHIEAKVNAPVIIRKTVEKDTNTIYISFIDYGVGMSPDRVENIYGVYFESTKRIDNTQIGGFGIGGKTPLAYKRSTGTGENEYDNSFFVITNYNGIKYTYVIFEGQESPEFTLIHQEATLEGNGTEIRIPVLPKDLESFRKEMVRQLYYFENIIFEGFEDVAILNNNYQIIRGKSFLYRGSDYSTNVHLCLGRVAYPLNYDVLGLSSSDFQFPIAIRLEVGQIKPTVSREAIDYSEDAIKLLRKKLVEVKEELTGMLTKQYESIVSLEDYFKVKNMYGHIYFPNGGSFYVGNNIKMTDINFSNFKYGFMKMPNDKELFRFFFDVKLYGKKESNSRRSRYSNDSNKFIGGYEAIVDENKPLYYFEGQFQRKLIKQAYLKDIHVRYYMISKKDIENIPDNTRIRNIVDLFEVNNDDVTTSYAESLLKLQEEYFNIIREHCTDYNEVEVPESFIENRKTEKVSTEIRNTTIPIKIIDGYKYRVKLDTLFKLNYRIFYGIIDDESILNTARTVTSLLFKSDIVIKRYCDYSNTFDDDSKQGILFIMISKTNVKYMQYCKHASHINEFSKFAKRKEAKVLEYFQSQLLIEKYNSLERLYKHHSFRKISPQWADNIEFVSSYVNDLERKTNGINLYRFTFEFKRFYDINNIQSTPELDNCIKIVEDGLIMQEVNSEVLKYINMSYLYDSTPVFIEMLKKVLVY